MNVTFPFPRRSGVIRLPGGIWQPFPFFLLAVLAGVLLAQLPLVWLVGGVAGTAVFLFTLVFPLAGVGVLLLVGPFSALENILVGHSTFDSGQIMLLFVTAVWLARSCIRRRLIIPRTFLTPPLLFFTLVAALSLLDADSLQFGVKELLKWLEINLLVVMVVDLANTAPQTKVPGHFLVLFLLLFTGFVQAMIGIWQYTLAGEGAANGVLGHFYLATQFFGQRVYGTFEQPNPFGGFMNLTALLAAGVLSGCGSVWLQKQPLKPFVLPLLGGVWGAATAALIFSLSRGAWLGFAAGTAVLVLFWPQKRWQGAALVGIAVVGLLAGWQLGLLPANVTNRLAGFQEDFTFGDVRGVDINDDNYAVLERLAHWQAALDMAREQPWLGVGFGNYEPAYARFALINWPFALGHAHNYYLNLLAETGVLGLLAYGVLWTAVFWQTLHLLHTLTGAERGIVLGLLAAWVAFSIHHLVDKLYVNNIYIHLGVMFALLQLLENKIHDGFTRYRRSWPLWH